MSSVPSSVRPLTADDLKLRNKIEEHLVSLAHIVFAGVSLLALEDGQLAAKITVGTDRLLIGKAQLTAIVPWIQQQGLVDIELELVRGRTG